jgi:hypothetical protein
MNMANTGDRENSGRRAADQHESRPTRPQNLIALALAELENSLLVSAAQQQQIRFGTAASLFPRLADAIRRTSAAAAG